MARRQINTHKKLNAGRGAVDKIAIFGMKGRHGKVKAMVVNCTNKTTLQGNIHNNIQAKSIVVADDFIDTKDRMALLFKGIGNNRISYKELTR